jgi:hypothetical protein
MFHVFSINLIKLVARTSTTTDIVERREYKLMAYTNLLYG